ncbi:MAG TPA: TetR/AcrR family transcriptional regulator [Hyphomicrobiaceae bacterium]|nr:TetR/AcrR family transcriptional regulator [Hyphomicrobiaceae bacterium]
MGRRSAHTAEELRELILEASTGLIETVGYAGLSAREIARRVNYSPGTLYNVFENLDDLVLTIEGRLLDRMSAALAEVPPTVDPRQRVHRLAESYLKFTHQHPRLWNLLFEHHMPRGQDVPAWYRQKLEGLMTQVEEALAPLMKGADPQTLKRSARVLWAGVHGITSLSTADKLSIISTESAGALVDDLVRTYLTGLDRMLERHSQASEKSP